MKVVFESLYILMFIIYRPYGHSSSCPGQCSHHLASHYHFYLHPSSHSHQYCCPCCCHRHRRPHCCAQTPRRSSPAVLSSAATVVDCVGAEEVVDMSHRVQERLSLRWPFLPHKARFGHDGHKRRCQRDGSQCMRCRLGSI